MDSPNLALQDGIFFLTGSHMTSSYPLSLIRHPGFYNFLKYEKIAEIKVKSNQKAIKM